MLRSISSLAAFVTLASTAFAHDGHGHPEHQHGVMHYALNPSHALPFVLTVAAVVVSVFLICRSARRWRA